MNPQKQLIKFLSFNLHPHSSLYNTIEGIISPKDISNQIGDLFSLLNVDYTEITYKEKTDVLAFLTNVTNDLSKGKIIVIYADSVNFDPVIYDQLMKFRESNKFELQNIQIPNQAKIFLITKDSDQKIEDKMRELTDHLLDLRKVS